MGPAAIPIIAVGLSAVGTAVTAYSAIKAGQDQAAAEKYNAAVAGNEATMVENQQQLVAQQDQRKASLDAGTIAANLGASGSAGGGSGADVALDVQNQHNLQTNTDLYLGQVSAYKFKTDQQGDQYQAYQAIPTSILRAGGALLNGGSSTAQMYNQDFLKPPSTNPNVGAGLNTAPNTEGP